MGKDGPGWGWIDGWDGIRWYGWYRMGWIDGVGLNEMGWENGIWWVRRGKCAGWAGVSGMTEVGWVSFRSGPEDRKMGPTLHTQPTTWVLSTAQQTNSSSSLCLESFIPAVMRRCVLPIMTKKLGKVAVASIWEIVWILTGNCKSLAKMHCCLCSYQVPWLGRSTMFHYVRRQIQKENKMSLSV